MREGTERTVTSPWNKCASCTGTLTHWNRSRNLCVQDESEGGWRKEDGMSWVCDDEALCCRCYYTHIYIVRLLRLMIMMGIREKHRLIFIVRCHWLLPMILLWMISSCYHPGCIHLGQTQVCPHYVPSGSQAYLHSQWVFSYLLHKTNVIKCIFLMSWICSTRWYAAGVGRARIVWVAVVQSDDSPSGLQMLLWCGVVLRF